MVDQSANDEQPSGSNAVRRRMLLKAAVGTGVAVAAHSTPRVSVVPAYGLTTTAGSDGKCYGITWSSNAPVSKGWQKVEGQEERFREDVSGPTTSSPPDGPEVYNGDHGLGPVQYFYPINVSGEFGLAPFTLTLTASGCVNTGHGAITPSGLPDGYCVKFLFDGRSSMDDSNESCTKIADGEKMGVGDYQIATLVLGNGQTTGIIVPPTTEPCTKSTEPYEDDDPPNERGNISWFFDVVPCP